MTSQIPDKTSFQTLFSNHSAIQSLMFEVLFATSNYGWLYEQSMSPPGGDITARDAAEKIKSGFPTHYTALFAKGNDLDTAIKKIVSDAPSYPKPFTGSDSPFPGYVSTLDSMYNTLISKSASDVQSAITSDDYTNSLTIINALRQFSEALFQIEAFYHSTMAAMNSNNTDTCPLAAQVLTVLKTLPELANIKWAYFYFVMIAQYTCLGQLRSPSEFYEAIIGYIKNLFTDDTGIKTALQYISEHIDKFNSCYAKSQIVLPSALTEYQALAAADPGSYMFVMCQPPPNDYPSWDYPSGWDGYLNYMSTIKDSVDAYLHPCYAHETDCSKPPKLPAPHFDDMVTILNSQIIAASARSAFVSLQPLTYWFSDWFTEPAIDDAGDLGNTFLGQSFTSDLSTAMSNVMADVTKLPSSVQADFKSLNDSYEVIKGALSKHQSDFVGQISALAPSLTSYSDLLGKIRSNYFDAVFSSPSGEVGFEGAEDTSKCPMKPDIDAMHTKTENLKLNLFAPIQFFKECVAKIKPHTESLQNSYEYDSEFVTIGKTVELVSKKISIIEEKTQGISSNPLGAIFILIPLFFTTFRDLVKGIKKLKKDSDKICK